MKKKKLLLTVQGFLRQRLKSSNVSVSPIDSMRKPKPTGNRSVPNQVTCLLQQQHVKWLDMINKTVFILGSYDDMCKGKLTAEGLYIPIIVPTVACKPRRRKKSGLVEEK